MLKISKQPPDTNDLFIFYRNMSAHVQSLQHSQRGISCLRTTCLPACLHISFAHPDKLSLRAMVWLRVMRRGISGIPDVRSDSSAAFLGVSRGLSGTGGASSGSFGLHCVGSPTTAVSLDVADMEGLGFSTPALACCDGPVLPTMEAGVCLRLEADYASSSSPGAIAVACWES